GRPPAPAPAPVTVPAPTPTPVPVPTCTAHDLTGQARADYADGQPVNVTTTITNSSQIICPANGTVMVSIADPQGQAVFVQGLDSSTSDSSAWAPGKGSTTVFQWDGSNT